MRLEQTRNKTDITLPSVILFDEASNMQQLMGSRYRVEAMTDEILIIDTIHEAAMITFIHVVGIDPEGDEASDMYEEHCIVAAYHVWEN